MQQMLKKLICFMTLIASSLVMAEASGPYPEEWWKPVPKEGAPAWEILPQEAGPGEVILSKRNELGILSNFAATAFTYKGVRYASIEGFWQMMKYPEGPDDERLKDPNIQWPFTRQQVAAMTAFEAKSAGSKANANMKALNIQWVTFENKKLNYMENAEGEFYQLVFAAMLEKWQQNPQVQVILKKTGTLILRPDHQQAPDAPPVMKYYQMWMKIREQKSQTKLSTKL